MEVSSPLILNVSKRVCFQSHHFVNQSTNTTYLSIYQSDSTYILYNSNLCFSSQTWAAYLKSS